MPTVLKVTTKVMNTEVTKCTVFFRGNDSKNHKGLDLIPKSTAETPEILAYDDGTVIQVQNYSGITDSILGPGMGTSIGIRHADGTVTRYQHLKHNSIRVKKGDKVKKGQVIALYGRPTNGNSTGPHLHFDISLPSKPKGDSIKSTFCGETRYYVDPLPYLTKPTGETKKEETPKTAGASYKVTASSLRVRNGPGTGYDTVRYLKNGAAVTVYGTKNGWANITKGKAEWCSMDYLTKI